MELLVVIAIIAVLVAIAIPMLCLNWKKAGRRQTLPMCALPMHRFLQRPCWESTTATVTVDLKQRTADWQSVDPVNIGGIVHSRGQADTDNWKGTATPGGSCVVSYDKRYGVVL